VCAVRYSFKHSTSAATRILAPLLAAAGACCVAGGGGDL
jgi:hypothetical protein